MSRPELLTPKELAQFLRRHISFVWAMRRCGFRMPGGVATLDAALDFLVKVPHPTSEARKKTNGESHARSI
jgi:hypothetical protein